MAEATETALACIREEVERAFSSAPGTVLEAALSRIVPQTSAPAPPRTPRGTPSRTPWGDWATLKTPSRVSPQLRGAPRWPSFPVRSRYSSPTTGSLPKACRKAGKT